jgi:hypothetical protein
VQGLTDLANSATSVRATGKRVCPGRAHFLDEAKIGIASGTYAIVEAPPIKFELTNAPG